MLNATAGVNADIIFEAIFRNCSGISQGEKVILECIDIPDDICSRMVLETLKVGATPVINQKANRVINTIASFGTKEVFQMMADYELHQMKQAKHFIGMRTLPYQNDMANVPTSQIKLLLEYYLKPVHYEYRNNHLNWLYFRWPDAAMAERAGMNLEVFYGYYLNSFLLDHKKVDNVLDPLVELLEKTNEVRIVGPNGTDITFRLGKYGVYKSLGKHNLPDGEIFTSPIKGSVNGTINFNIDSTYYGTHFTNVRLTFENGKVIEAISNNSKRINELLDIDTGARFIGEFAIGFNPFIHTPINDILFDEKMYGSVHIALGNAYPVSDNGNRSSIHWDLILNQNIDYGGGNIYFDDILVRKDGRFIPEYLQVLNPENLKKFKYGTA